MFAGLSETDDPSILAALERLYERFHGFVRKQVTAHRAKAGAPVRPDEAARIAWAIVGLGTMADIGRELGLLSARERERLVGEVGRALLADGTRARSGSGGSPGPERSG